MIWWNGDEHKRQLLQSFCDLVCSTNIIAAYSVTNAEADAYTDHFFKYRSSIQQLYIFRSRPNHHYAMHNGDLLKFWGPLSLLSEFPGEWMNGDLGKIKTNWRLCSLFILLLTIVATIEFIIYYIDYMELTMLRQTARRGCLEALLHDDNFENTAAAQLAKILEPDNNDRSSSTHIMSDVEVANAHASATRPTML